MKIPRPLIDFADLIDVHRSPLNLIVDEVMKIRSKKRTDEKSRVFGHRAPGSNHLANVNRG